MEDSSSQYQEYRIWPMEGCQETIDILDWTLFAAVCREFSESTTGWGKSPVQCVTNIIILSIISIREGFLPDFLQRLLGQIKDISDLLDEEEQVCYRDDMHTLKVLMLHVPYKIIDTGHDWDGIEDSIPPAIRQR